MMIKLYKLFLLSQLLCTSVCFSSTLNFTFKDVQSDVSYRLYVDGINDQSASISVDNEYKYIKHVVAERIRDRRQHVYHMTAYNATEESLPSNSIRLAPAVGTQYKNVRLRNN